MPESTTAVAPQPGSSPRAKSVDPRNDKTWQSLTGGRGSSLSNGRKFRNGSATFLVIACFVFTAAPLLWMFWDVLRQGLEPVLSLDWWTKDIPGDVVRSDLAGNELLQELGFETGEAIDPGSVALGMQPAIVGTILTVLAASALAIPLGILGAVYLNEYGRRDRLAKLIRFMTDVMTGVPSVIMGVFIYTIWVIPRGVGGRSAWAAGLALACLMLPIVVRATEEMLRLVPDSLREGSAALGTRPWKTTLTVVIPAALAGIVSGSLLAVARAAGETAPVVFVIGFTTATNFSLQGGNTTLSAQIYSQQQNGGPLATQLAWGAAVTLVGIVLVATLAARWIAKRYSSQEI